MKEVLIILAVVNSLLGIVNIIMSDDKATRIAWASSALGWALAALNEIS